MKQIFILNFILLIVIQNVFNLTVDVDEIRTDKKIEFINYTGKHKIIDTVWTIRSIGVKLSKFEKNNEAFRYFMKYSIIHAVDDTIDDRFNADIFSIEKSAKVDHIRNVRLIISGYLEKKYGYSRKDALLLATIVTYYNAVYRGDIDYFTKRYKPVVMKHINKKNAGISTKYYEWSGTTKVLIPLTDEAGEKTISSLDTTELTETKVIEELRKEQDKGVKERKDITKFQEKEIREQKKQIGKEKKRIEEEKKGIEKQKEKIEKEKKEIAKIEDKKERKIKEEEIKKDEIKLEEKKEDVKKDEQAIGKKEGEIKKKKEKIEKEKEKIKKDEEKIKIRKDPKKFEKELEKKTQELEKKEKELSAKEEELKKKEAIDENIYADKFYYLKIKKYMVEGHYNNEMYLIDAKTRKVILVSPLKEICGKKYDVFKNGVVVVSYPENHSSPHHLTLLDLNTLEPIVTGKDNIFWRSFVEIKEDYIYAIIKNGENYYLGKFNSKMEKIAKSDTKIDYSTFITFYREFIYINSEKKEILVLKKDDLSLIDTIKP